MFTILPSQRRLMNQINGHIARTIGPCPMVFHDRLADGFALDLHVIPPQKGGPSAAHPHGRDFFTFVTSGLSGSGILEGDVGEGTGLIELMISLPSDWPGLRADGTFGMELMRNPASAWPLQWLKTVARLIRDAGTQVVAGQALPNDVPAMPFAGNTGFTDMFILPSVLHPKAETMVMHDDAVVAFYALWPVDEVEMQLLREEGAEALKKALLEQGVTDLVGACRRKQVG